MPNIPRSFLVVLALITLGVAPLRADVASDRVAIQSLPDGLYQVNGSFSVDVPLQSVWEMLSDYDKLKGTVKSLVYSQVMERRGDRLVVEQKARGSFLFFSRTVALTLAILECKPRSIAFEDLSKKDFKVYKGRWDLQPLDEGGVKVSYELTASRGSFAPEAIEQHVFRGQAQSMLKEIKASLQKAASVP